MRPNMIVVGTRPEGIKMMPLYFALKKAGLPVVLCSTDQHSTLLQEVFDLFKVVPDIRLALMKPGQDLSYLTCAVLESMKQVYESVNPSLVLVQGDTTTVMASALAAFYQKIPVGHVEAGLRTGDRLSPYPEEINREMVGLVAAYHFAPTQTAMANLLAEGKSRETVFYTGNTVVDALQYVQTLLQEKKVAVSPFLESVIAPIAQQGKLILVTMHRRESFPDGIVRSIAALKNYAAAHPDCFFIYPHHPNPFVVQALRDAQLVMQKNIFLIPPVAYHELVYLLNRATCVMTDSGGIQEEAVSLGKHVLVLRDKSERMEGVWQGSATIVGTQENAIIEALNKVLAQTGSDGNKKEHSVYGDGHAAEHIVRIIQEMHRKSIQRNNV